GATVDDVARAHAHRRGVAGQLLQAHASGFALLVGRVRVDEGLLQLETLLGVTGDDNLALLVARNLALLSPAYRSSRKSTCLRTTVSYFLSTRRSGLLRRFFLVTYVKPVPAVERSLMIGRTSCDLFAIRASHPSRSGP